jgi:hypothetical protein
LARELCQQIKTVQVPGSLNDKILEATTGAAQRASKAKRQDIAKHLTASFAFGWERFRRLVTAPEFVTAMLLCLATVGLLLVDFSDDQSLRGVYRQASLRTEQILSQRSSLSKEKIAANVQEITTKVDGVIDLGLALFSGNPSPQQSTPSEPPAKDQQQRRDHQIESTPHQESAKPKNSRRRTTDDGRP